ncbi:MAG TPA: hypothetical protein VL359_02420, partial [bacterium]|nr:hypothetical protein [bacterium]
ISAHERQEFSLRNLKMKRQGETGIPLHQDLPCGVHMGALENASPERRHPNPGSRMAMLCPIGNSATVAETTFRRLR